MQNELAPLVDVLVVSLLFSLVVFFLFTQGMRVFRRMPKHGIFARRRVRKERPWPALRHEPIRGMARTLAWAGYTPRRARNALLIELSIGVLFSLIFSSRTPIFLACIILIVGGALLLYRANKQRRRFLLQLPDALDALVQSLRAGFALADALKLVARETQDPAERVFLALARAHEYHIDFQEAARMIEKQIGSAEWALVAEALHVQERIGGNVIPILGQVASTIREKVRIDHEMASVTASGRLSGIIIALLAPISFVGFSIFAPDYIGILVTSQMGKLLILIAILLEATGFFIIWRIVRIDY